MRKLIMCAGLLFLTASCAKVYYTTFDYTSNGKVGSLQIKLSKNLKNVSVTIDNQLMAENKHTGKIIIRSIPMGLHEIKVTGTDPFRKDLNKKVEVVIEPGQLNTLSIKAPPRTVLSYVYEFVLPVVGIVVGIIIADLSPNSYSY